MAINQHKRSFRRFIRSKRGLSLPITFLILLTSTLGIISVTYYISVSRLNIQSETLKASTAEQTFQSLDKAILSTLGQPGSSATFDLTDSGGSINIRPTNRVLTITCNDSLGDSEIIFNSSVGEVSYELSNLGSRAIGLYLAGDGQTITNQTGASLSQLYITQGNRGPEIQLSYRPTVSYVIAGLEDGKPAYDIRIYVMNLNSSGTVSQYGELPLKISCLNSQLITNTLQVPYQTESLSIISQIDGTTDTISIPISSTPQGAIINIETVISSISIQRSIR
jgi:hypothetical protein